MQKFTPGPWRYAIARWAEETPAAGFTIYADSVRKAPDGSEVGLATGGTTGGSWAFSAFFSPEEIDANARLISAAPELYAALQNWLETYVPDHLSDFDHEHGDCPEGLCSTECKASGCIALKIHEARAALAKATGGIGMQKISGGAGRALSTRSS